MNQGKSISHQFIRTCPMFEPLLNEIHHFYHHSWKFIYYLPQFVRVWHLLESVELTSQGSDALCKAFHCFRRFFLGLEMLPNLSVISFASKTEKEVTWYAISMQENTVFATEFSLLKSNNGHVRFSGMIYLADSLSYSNYHLHTIGCRTKMTQDGFKLVQVLDRTSELYIQCGQGRVEGLQLNLSRKFLYWEQSR